MGEEKRDEMWRIPEGMEDFLKETEYCNWNTEEIRKKAAELTKGVKTPKEAAMRIFLYVRDKFPYMMTFPEKATETVISNSDKLGMRRRSLHMEPRRGQRNQTARDNSADSCSKGTGSKACAAMYRTCQLPGGLGLIKEDPWQTKDCHRGQFGPQYEEPERYCTVLTEKVLHEILK